jgi:hypothetical protein
MPKPVVRRSSTYLQRRRWTPEDAKEALVAQAQSGLSLSAFASHEGLDAQRLFRWRRRLDADAPETATFEEVVGRGVTSAFGDGGPPPGSESARFEVVLRSGLVVRVAESFNADALLRLLNTLVEVRSC